MGVRIFFIMGALLCSFAACAAPAPTPTPAPPKFDARTALPCQILTREDAVALLGMPVHETTMGNVPNLAEASFVTCAYLTMESPPSGVSVTLFGRRDPAEGITFFQNTKTENQARASFVEIQGLGDEAFWSGALLLARQGEQVIGVTAARAIREHDFEMAKRAAQTVLARIQ